MCASSMAIWATCSAAIFPISLRPSLAGRGPDKMCSGALRVPRLRRACAGGIPSKKSKSRWKKHSPGRRASCRKTASASRSRFLPGPAPAREVRLKGQGTSGIGGPAGDLYLVVKVLPHDTFERDGDHLRCKLPVDLYTAVLGGDAIVHALGGDVKLKIPPETQSGRTIRLAGQGMPHLRDSKTRGDLLVQVQVMIPQKLTERERELFQAGQLGPGGDDKVTPIKPPVFHLVNIEVGE